MLFIHPCVGIGTRIHENVSSSIKVSFFLMIIQKLSKIGVFSKH